jgi:hypothetical protein
MIFHGNARKYLLRSNHYDITLFSSPAMAPENVLMALTTPANLETLGLQVQSV